MDTRPAGQPDVDPGVFRRQAVKRIETITCSLYAGSTGPLRLSGSRQKRRPADWLKADARSASRLRSLPIPFRTFPTRVKLAPPPKPLCLTSVYLDRTETPVLEPWARRLASPRITDGLSSRL